MPNKLKDGTLRVSYVEDQVMHKAVSLYSELNSISISEVIRKAVEKHLHEIDPSGEFVKAAQACVVDRDTRGGRNPNPATVQLITRLVNKHTKS